MALDPVDHIAAVAGAKSNCAGGVDVGEIFLDVFESFYEVFVGAASPVVADSVLERHAVASTTCGIGSYYDVALLGEDGWVPAR